MKNNPNRFGPKPPHTGPAPEGQKLIRMKGEPTSRRDDIAKPGTVIPVPIATANHLIARGSAEEVVL